MIKAEWYVDWFNSPYYHLLYNNRNEDEANLFIDNLCNKLELKTNTKIWDLACGKGRHAIALSKKGYHVIGSDLSENSILEAKKSSTKNLDFFLHDMRLPFSIKNFDAVFNLFTSLGYFKDINENFFVFKNVSNALNPNGIFVVDFFNAKKVTSSLNKKKIEQRGPISFGIEKKILNNAIVKHIEFSDNKQHFYFEESVSLLNLNDFECFAKQSGFKLLSTFGNYHLEPFDEINSDRLILIFKKI